MLTPNIDEALRYLGVPAPAPVALREQAERVSRRLCAALRPRWVWRVFPLERTEAGFALPGTGVALAGHTAEKMLAECHSAALLACTLGSEFDALLRAEQVRDMSDAAVLDALGSAYVEAGCNEAEQEIAARLPNRFLTDRFSPGYGDLPLSLQPAICTALDTPRRLGLHVTGSLLLNPVKSVTAVIGLSGQPQKARVRGCAYCRMRDTCALRKGGKSCAI